MVTRLKGKVRGVRVKCRLLRRIILPIQAKSIMEVRARRRSCLLKSKKSVVRGRKNRGKRKARRTAPQ